VIFNNKSLNIHHKLELTKKD